MLKTRLGMMSLLLGKPVIQIAGTDRATTWHRSGPRRIFVQMINARFSNLFRHRMVAARDSDGRSGRESLTFLEEIDCSEVAAGLSSKRTQNLVTSTSRAGQR
jgi:hypothetical protein